MQLRPRLYRQLAVAAWKGPGLSPLNAVICSIILLNLVLQILETEPKIRAATGSLLDVLDWIFVAVFSVEYLARVWVAGENPRFRGLRGRLRYMVTFFSLVDLVSILPAYLSLGSFDSSGMRSLRLVRVLRFARFGAFSVALKTVTEVVMTRVYELAVSVVMAVGLLLIASTLMFFAEGDIQREAFGSIPRALWWGVVTMTTVGYGDATPETGMGKLLAAIIAMTAIAIIAIPTGILAASFSDVVQRRKLARRAAAGGERADSEREDDAEGDASDHADVDSAGADGGAAGDPETGPEDSTGNGGEDVRDEGL